jgi:hypothetical protein
MLVKDYSRKIPLPPAPPPRRAQASATPGETAAPTVADEKLTGYNVIVAKHLFNPSRSEGGPAPTAPAPPPPPKPTLLGVVVDGPKSRAYLEDAVTKRVFGYRIGDSISGGRLDKITDDKVVIVRPTARSTCCFAIRPSPSRQRRRLGNARAARPPQAEHRNLEPTPPGTATRDTACRAPSACRTAAQPQPPQQ